jgi:hypothetical protein
MDENNEEIKEKKEEPTKEEKKDEIFQKNNYDIDSPEQNLITINDEKKNKFEDIFEKDDNNNKKDEKKKKYDDEFIIFPKTGDEFEDENKINRFSNLKEIELPLEDEIQIEKQVDDNDNESEQIEVIENILNNFEKDKNKKKNNFLIYKNNTINNKKNVFKSYTVDNKKSNHLLNKIKNDIALIKFEQEINKMHNNRTHNHKLFLTGEKININIINNNLNKKNINLSKKNLLRIEEIKRKLYSRGNSSNNNTEKKTRSISNNKRIWNKSIINRNKKEENYFSSSNDFYKNKSKQKIFDNLINEINNNKEIQIKNFNNNNIYNNFYNTFRNKRIYVQENEIILPVNTKRKKNYYKDKNITDDDYYMRTEELTKSPYNNSNQFFYNVFKMSIKKYPFLHLLKNKVNKMKKSDFSEPKMKYALSNNDEEKINEPKISILDKIKFQKDILKNEMNRIKNKL